MTVADMDLGLLSRSCIWGVTSSPQHYITEICGYGFSPEGAEESARKNVDGYNKENPYLRFTPLGTNMRTSEGWLHSIWKWIAAPFDSREDDD